MPAETPRVRVVIVDDEAPARALLREYLAAHADIGRRRRVRQRLRGGDGRSARLAPDLVLLDVQMPKLDGFEVLELLERPPCVVFVTAFDEYAVRAFEVHAVDYVLKPVGRERFGRALAGARERLAAAPSGRGPQAVTLAAAARAPGQHLARVLVKDGPDVHVIPVARLDWLEAQDDYVALHVEGRTYLKTQPLADLVARLDPLRFVRIHRSYAINLDRLARLVLEAKDQRVVILKDGKTLPVSRAGYARLRELM